MGFLESAPLLVSRLKERCPSAQGNVFSTAELAGVQEKAQITPALHVVLHSYAPENDDDGPTNTWVEVYLVVAAVKHAGQRAGAAPVLNESAALLRESLAALAGWQCPGTLGTIKLERPPKPLSADAFGYFPLAFSVRTITEGCQDDQE